MNIVLIGFASCGKSATAYELSKRLFMKFIDLDKEIELRYYLSHNRELHYREIIESEGSEHFFKLENLVLEEIAHLDGCVIAPGGGAPLRIENRCILEKLGPIVYIKTTPEVLLQRMCAKGIPLFLRNDPSIQNVKRIWLERDMVYSDMASFSIDNSHMSIAETADRVMQLLNL